MPPSPQRDYSHWFGSAIVPPPDGLSAHARDMLRLDQDLRHLFEYVYAGLDDVTGRGEFDELKASPKFYAELASEFMDFAALHPEKASRVLQDVFRLIEMQPSVREDNLQRRRSMDAQAA